MSAQAGKPPETPGSAGQQVTPVIIKTGGDLEDPQQYEVTIQLMGNAFDSPPGEGEWRSAQSSVTAGMINLEIQDGDINKTASANPRLEGTKLQIIFGTHMLTFDNEALPEPHRTRVTITSPVLFTVVEQGKVPGQWLESHARFRAENPPLVIFSQGGHVFTSYQCQTNDVELTLSLEWDETVG